MHTVTHACTRPHSYHAHKLAYSHKRTHTYKRRHILTLCIHYLIYLHSETRAQTYHTYAQTYHAHAQTHHAYAQTYHAHAHIRANV